jgi:ADP-dependent NAD(P)H-hydrate dehydratase / NAD(P)H-hydrate epimerase
MDLSLIRRLRGRAELLTPAEMAQADALAPGLGAAGAVLMAAAGRAVARAVRTRFRPCRTLVLCGPGNNGGDGYVAARLLAQEGWPVATAALAPPRGDDAEAAAAAWHGPTAAFTLAAVERAALVIDAVFGAGLARDVDGRAADALRAARRLVAIDVPSGLDGATGAVRGFAAQAALTVTFFRLKPGHLLLPGRELCGDIVLADIGLPAAVLKTVRPRAVANLPGNWRLPRPTPEGHKYSRGHVTVVGGPAMTGAARLAAEAARRIGAGMVTIAAPWGGADVYRAGNPGTIVTDAGLPDLLADARRHVWVCGPGLGADAARQALPVVLAARRAVVADADTFSAFANRPDALAGAAVLTPHAAEFARVFGAPGADRLEAARAAAARTGAALVLKGADTIIAAPDGRAAINANAPPWLATAGSGDVLAGVIGGLLAQGMPPWDAACAGVFVHGSAGLRAGPGLIAEDLLVALRAAGN